MAAPDPNARPTEGNRHPADEVDESQAHNLIEKCIQLYMDRDETARALEIHFGIVRQLTRLVWDKLEECNQEFFQNYYTRLASIRQIVRFNELLEQQDRAMNSPLVPEQVMSMEPVKTAPRANSSVSKTSNENEAESNKLPANPVGFVGSEEVVGSDPNLVPNSSLAQFSLENAASDTAHMPISLVPNLIAESGFHHRIMAAPDPNAWPMEGNRYPEDEVDEAHNLIEKCIQRYMDREETAHVLEIHFGIVHQLTHIVWDKLEECNQEFFQNYYARLALKRQIVRFNELLEQQDRAMNSPLVPVEHQMSMEPAETARRVNSPVCKTSNENEAESNKLPANPVGIVGSEEVVGSDPSLVPSGSLAESSLENAALDTAHMSISQVPNLNAGDHHTANLRGPVQSSSSMAQSLSHLDSNPEASEQKDVANSASGQGSPSTDL